MSARRISSRNVEFNRWVLVPGCLLAAVWAGVAADGPGEGLNAVMLTILLVSIATWIWLSMRPYQRIAVDGDTLVVGSRGRSVRVPLQAVKLVMARGRRPGVLTWLIKNLLLARKTRKVNNPFDRADDEVEWHEYTGPLPLLQEFLLVLHEPTPRGRRFRFLVRGWRRGRHLAFPSAFEEFLWAAERAPGTRVTGRVRRRAEDLPDAATR